MKKAILSILIVLMLGSSFACGAPAVQGQEKALILQMNAMEGTLDPAAEAIGTYSNYALLCVDPLISFDDKGNLIYEAAASYEVNDDQTVWTFHLRQNGKWSDGSPVTADDFINTIHRTLLPTSTSHYVGELFVLENAERARNEGAGAAQLGDVGARALDAYTLEFTLTAPCPYFLKLLTLPVYAPSKAGAASSSDPNWYMYPATNLGNGAFHMVRYVQDEEIVLAKNPHYHQADKVKLDSVVLRVIPDTMAAVGAYETGEVDVASGLMATVIEQYDGKPDLYYWHMQSNTFMQFNLNNAPVLQDVRVRQAITLGIHRAELCTLVGSDIFPSYSYVASGMTSNCSDKKFSEERPRLFDENIPAAQALLAEAGYPGGAGFPVLTYTYPNHSNNGDVAVALQAQLKENLGITIQLNGIETGVFHSMRRSGDYELLRNSWVADYTDPINYLMQFKSDGMFARAAGVSDSLVDEWVGRSNAELDPMARNALLHDAEQEIVAKQFYLAPLYSQVYVGLRNPRITGFEKNDRDESLYRFANIVRD